MLWIIIIIVVLYIVIYIIGGIIGGSAFIIKSIVMFIPNMVKKIKRKIDVNEKEIKNEIKCIPKNTFAKYTKKMVPGSNYRYKDVCDEYKANLKKECLNVYLKKRKPYLMFRYFNFDRFYEKNNISKEYSRIESVINEYIEKKKRLWEYNAETKVSKALLINSIEKFNLKQSLEDADDIYREELKSTFDSVSWYLIDFSNKFKTFEDCYCENFCDNLDRIKKNVQEALIQLLANQMKMFTLSEYIFINQSVFCEYYNLPLINEKSEAITDKIVFELPEDELVVLNGEIYKKYITFIKPAITAITEEIPLSENSTLYKINEKLYSKSKSYLIDSDVEKMIQSEEIEPCYLTL